MAWTTPRASKQISTRRSRTKIYVMGLATYCVYYSVVDALSLGYMVMLLEDATKRISANGTKQVLKDMT